ncbi:MAG TPA: styrene monooxygenase/indole monooxygenase family protein [Pseudonocardiaceae bacterium]|nr:styrene monooxygenase/indole monooxygenase family protein [Pseudonocardiaceae bacterium]
MTADVAIIGTGISGIQLALRLQQAGAATTVYAERSLADVAAGPPLNMVVRFEQTRARERELGVSHWAGPDSDVIGINFAAEGDHPLGFYGQFDQPGSGVDFRVYLPRLVEDYVERGGELKVLAIDVPTVEALSERHDLVVVATGRNGFSGLFPRDPLRSEFAEPQRRLTAGFYHGIAPSDPSWVQFQLVPGAGEIFCTKVLTLGGAAHGMVVEGLPGTPLEALSRVDHRSDQRGFERTVLELVTEFAPQLRERIDEREFRLVRPIDVLQGAITPTVRKGWTRLSTGRFAMAVGDAWIVNDPVSGQGANLGSRCAFALADEILANDVFDEEFCRRTEDRLWAVAEPVVLWSNAILGPPSDAVLDVLSRAGDDPRIANAFTENFNRPEEMWEMSRSAEGTERWLARVGG